MAFQGQKLFQLLSWKWVSGRSHSVHSDWTVHRSGPSPPLQSGSSMQLQTELIIIRSKFNLLDINILAVVTKLAASVPHFLRVEVGGVCSEAAGINSGQLAAIMQHELSTWSPDNTPDVRSLSLQSHIENPTTELTGLFQVFTGLGLCEWGHFVELGVEPRVFKTAEVDTFAVHDTVWQLLGQMLLGLLWKRKQHCVCASIKTRHQLAY